MTYACCAPASLAPEPDRSTSNATYLNPSVRADGPTAIIAPGIRERSLHGSFCSTGGSHPRPGVLMPGHVGAFEFAIKLEGNAVTYLVLAAPVIAGAASSIPVLAEATWRDRAYLKSLLWWLALVPAGAVVFYSAAERVHVAKAGAQAERSAFQGAATRAQAALTKAEHSLDKARADANKARGQKQCGPDCRSKLAAETVAQADVDAARQALLKSESVATTDSPITAPVWLLPAALDLVAFMAQCQRHSRSDQVLPCFATMHLSQRDTGRGTDSHTAEGYLGNRRRDLSPDNRTQDPSPDNRTRDLSPDNRTRDLSPDNHTRDLSIGRD